MKLMPYIILIVLFCLTACASVNKASGPLKDNFSLDELRFCLDHELLQKVAPHTARLSELLYREPLPEADLRLILEYAQRAKNYDLATKVHYQLATLYGSLEDGLQWVSLSDYTATDSLSYAMQLGTLRQVFSAPADSIVFENFYAGNKEADYLPLVKDLEHYNPLIEDLAKTIIDEISVESSDSLAIELCTEFYDAFPNSKWLQTAYYYHLFHLSALYEYPEFLNLITDNYGKSPAHAYLSSVYLLSPSQRRNLKHQFSNYEILSWAQKMFGPNVIKAEAGDEVQVLYDVYSEEHWENRVKLQEAKLFYYYLLEGYGYYGDEDSLVAIIPEMSDELDELIRRFDEINFDNNDTGELAELWFWKGKVLALSSDPKMLEETARAFSLASVYGAPRKKYDVEAWKYILALHKLSKVKTDPLTWCRKLLDYNGIIFREANAELGFGGEKYSRIAVGDYNNDGNQDLLFNGHFLYKNNGDSTLTQIDANLKELNAHGGVWADFNRDGKLDLAAITNAEDPGEQLMKNQGDDWFVGVNERAGDIADRYPTEGVAWIDAKNDGYPDLYVANYEKWQVQSGFPDYYWENEKGYFTDMSDSLGFRLPDYTHDPGQAGRGVAPADFDNDGIQEIYVTNYRLNRNFCFKQAGKMWVDVAPLYAIQGKYKEGYYGHSIGADWGDYDNDGDLDLFVANLAHPRYINISDVSILYRNDGLGSRVIDGETVYYWQFTDVTKAAGITFDELHSDPLWIDADNDGWLDLFITSVYENDRSYLYKNKGDGTFKDITWLAGARVYNGWGTALADLNRDGKADLIVGSGNGARILLNETVTDNQALWLKPVWEKGKVTLLQDYSEHSKHPNSPAFGTRVRLRLQRPDGSQYSLIRELSGGKGTSSQSAQELPFGLGDAEVIEIQKVDYAQPKN